VLWLWAHEGTSTAVRSELRELGMFVDSSNHPWTSDPERAEHGCVIIVHGLWGPPKLTDPSGTYWMKEMGAAIEDKMGEASPSVLLLDWNLAATPSTFYGANNKAKLRDIAQIRNQAYEVGDFAGIRLTRMIESGAIRKDRPLHLIGHSAGGFVVARMALELEKHGAVPNRFRVTILDTPVRPPDLPLIRMLKNFQDDEVLQKLPQKFPGLVDFYVTSVLPGLPPNFKGPPSLHLRWPHDEFKFQDSEKDHAYACDWYIETIKKGGHGEGFDLSPLLLKD
jgi:pimeloyl-ACP methyl ester carboxylesterase